MPDCDSNQTVFFTPPAWEGFPPDAAWRRGARIWAGATDRGATPTAGAAHFEKREFNPRFFPLSHCTIAIIALQVGPANRHWNDMDDTGGDTRRTPTAPTRKRSRIAVRIVTFPTLSKNVADVGAKRAVSMRRIVCNGAGPARRHRTMDMRRWNAAGLAHANAFAQIAGRADVAVVRKHRRDSLLPLRFRRDVPACQAVAREAGEGWCGREKNCIRYRSKP